MRIWDTPANKLCTKHLLGEHSELHGLWNILTQNKSGYSRHPETLRWKGKLAALYLRHEELVIELKKRNYQHKSFDLRNGIKTLWVISFVCLHYVLMQ